MCVLPFQFLKWLTDIHKHWQGGSAIKMSLQKGIL